MKLRNRSRCLATLLACVALSAHASKETGGPIAKVVTLLKDLKVKIEADEQSDQKAHDKYMCWCDRVEEAKAQTIKEAETLIADLTADISKGEAEKASKETAIEQNEADVQSKKDTKEEEEKVYAALFDSFSREQAENKQVLASLNKAKAMLTDPDATALLQTDDSPLKLALKDVITALPADAKLQPKKLELLSQASGSGTSTDPAMAPSMVYILDELYEQYNNNLVTIEEKATQDKESHTAMIGDLNAALDLLDKDRVKLDSQLAVIVTDLADDNKLKDDTEKQLTADQAFLSNTTTACTERRAEFEERNSQRAQELQGVNAALDHITSDDARELMQRSIKTAPSFLQLDSNDLSASERAYQALHEQALKTNSRRLSAMALQVQRLKSLSGGVFDSVISSIDEMITTLKKEETSDKDKKAYCQKEYHKIEKDLNKYSFLVQKNDAKIARLQTKVKIRTEEKAKAAAAIAANDKELEELTTLRNSENDVFTKEKKDDEAAITLLQETRAKLAEFYEGADETKTADLLLAGAKEEPEELGTSNEELARSGEDYSLSDKNSNKGAADMILGMIDHIIDSMRGEISKGQADEDKSLAEFEAQKADLLSSNKDLSGKITGLDGMIADRNNDIGDQETEKASSEKNIVGQQGYQEQIKPECDWIISKFDERYDKRESELDGLKNAKYMLQNVNGPTLLQTRSTRNLRISDPRRH